MWDLNIKIIKVGSCTIDPGKMASKTYVQVKNDLGIGGGSTVTVIRSGSEVLLVDTGYERESDTSKENDARNAKVLDSLLKLNGLLPSDVSAVFITHFHRDHFGGIETFKNARWYCYHLARDDFRHDLVKKFTVLHEGDEIVPNARVMHTPGHTNGHASVLWTTGDPTVRIAICGDAITNLAWLQSGFVWRFNSDFADEEAARKSVVRIVDSADIAIPGHGQPFFITERLKRLARDQSRSSA